ncbi:MAG: helix-turn-helix transcriptional regulator [Desulfobacterales bacterium]|nr:helix-turn-helix transcriptional regulator [Desulfobacterales bacterium]MDD4071423.1 helix-turn-helix transcriptional regulator [Desulfobacterales bacterium]MDD4392037.1 helix-turn-helix transcriptional regulator [Desulfobacterales bacterium]
MKSFGKALKKARTAKRVTLRILSEHVGKSVGYLSDIENNRKRPPVLDIVEKMEECLGVYDGTLVALASQIRKKIPKEWTDRIMLTPKLSEALLRADEDLTDKEFDDLMNYFKEIKKKREDG